MGGVLYRIDEEFECLIDGFLGRRKLAGET